MEGFREMEPASYSNGSSVIKEEPFFNDHQVQEPMIPHHEYSERNKLFLASLGMKRRLPMACDSTGGLLELAHKLRMAERDMHGDRSDAVAGLLPISVIHPGAMSATSSNSPDVNGLSAVTVKQENGLTEGCGQVSPGKHSLWSVLTGATGSEELDIDGESLDKYKTECDFDGRDALAKPLTATERNDIINSAINCVIETKSYQNNGQPVGEADPGESDTNVPVVPVHLAEAGVLRKFKCPLCTYETDNKSHLKRHQSSVHAINVPFHCYICKRDFARSEKIRHHFLRVHPKVPYEDRLCRKSCFQPGEASNIDETCENLDMEASMPAMEPVEPKDDSTESQEVNFAAALQEDFSDKEQTSCSRCSFVGRDIWALKRHFMDRHCNNKPFHCPECSYSTSRRHRMITHLKNHGKLICMYCKEVSEDFPSFQKHLNKCCTEDTAKKLTCQHCNVTLPNKKLLVDHKAKYHSIHLYSCNLCVYTSEDQAELQNHMLLHVQATRVCEICQEVFDSLATLHTHRKLAHPDAGPLYRKQPVPKTFKNSPSSEIKKPPMMKCSKCPFETYSVTMMKSHEGTHGAVNSCGYGGCTFSTTQEKLMDVHRAKSHKEQHIMEKMYETKGLYECPLCTDRPPFRYRRSYEKHLERTHTKDEKCPLCDERFYTFDALKYHIKHRHDAEVEEVSESDEEGVDTGGAEGGEPSTHQKQQHFGAHSAELDESSLLESGDKTEESMELEDTDVVTSGQVLSVHSV